MICRGQCERERVNSLLTMIFKAALTIKFQQSLTIYVPSSFAQARESATEGAMNPILFMIGGWPVHITDVVVAFAVTTLLLLLTITIVVARSGRAGTAGRLRAVDGRCPGRGR